MARIVHVDDRPEWITVVRRALADHWVDSALTYDEALRLIRGPEPYDLALIDLNLIGDDDRMGAGLLDLLMTEFPETRRVVVTASAPEREQRAGVFERYRLDALIIKGTATVPGLQMIVNLALKQVPHEVKFYESELTERYRNWRDRVADEIRAILRSVENRARDAGRFGAQAAQDAAATLGDWLAVRTQFERMCTKLEIAISAAMTIDDVNSASRQFEQLIIEIANGISRLRSV